MRKIFLMIILIVLTGCQTQTSKFSESFLSFDTQIDFTAYTKNEKEFNKYFDQAKNDFDKYFKLFNAYENYDKINNVKTINDNAGKKAINVDSELFDLIKKSREYYKNASQKNNIALAPVVLEYKKVLNEYAPDKEVDNPSAKLLKEKDKCTNMNDIVLNDKDKTILLKNKCNRIDVGSVAKGYTANKIAENMKKSGLKSGILNAGGNVVIIGSKNGKDFSIGIANPDESTTSKIIINSKDKNIVTSGDYQRYYVKDGIKMNHIIDPDTLKPGMINKSVTIVCDDGLLADYFSTESFMLDNKEIAKLAKKFKFEYIVIDKKDKIIVSEGIKDAVEVK